MSVGRPSREAVDFDVVGEYPASSGKRRPVPGRLAPLARIESLYDDPDSWHLLPPDEQRKRELAHESAQRSLQKEKLSLIRQLEQQQQQQTDWTPHDVNGYNNNSVVVTPTSIDETDSSCVSADDQKTQPLSAASVVSPNAARAQSEPVTAAVSGNHAANKPTTQQKESPVSEGNDESKPLIAAAAAAATAPTESGDGRGKRVSGGGGGGGGGAAVPAQKQQQQQPQTPSPSANSKTMARHDKLKQDLTEAVRAQSPSKVKKLLKSRSAIDVPSSAVAKLGPFHDAIRRGVDVAILKAFVDVEPRLVAAADPDDGQTALLVAVQAGRPSTVQWLVDCGDAKLDIRNAKTDFGVWEAARKQPQEDPASSTSGRVGGRSMAATLVGLFRKHRKEYSTTPIHEAAATGRSDMIDYLVGIGLELWMDDQGGYNFLHVAAFNNRSDVVDHFASPPQDASVDLASGVERKNESSGKTPLHVAANRGNLETVKVLVACGARPTTVDAIGWTALHDAAAGRRADTTTDVLSLLVRRAPGVVRAVTADGETALHVAARHGRTKAVRTLIEIDPGPLTVADRDGWTPLHGAVSSRRTEVVAALLDTAVERLGPEAAARLSGVADEKGQTPRQLVIQGDASSEGLMQVLAKRQSSMSANKV